MAGNWGRSPFRASLAGHNSDLKSKRNFWTYCHNSSSGRASCSNSFPFLLQQMCIVLALLFILGK